MSPETPPDDASPEEASPGRLFTNVAGEVKTRIDSPPRTYFLDHPVVSHDDRYVLVESASGSLDYYPSNAQPKDARLLLHDRSTGKMIEEVRGLDPVWNR